MLPRSAGIVAFRRTEGRIEVLLVHPGGPFWRNKDIGAWSIPKGEYGAGDVQTIRSNTLDIKWPPRNGRRQVFPEIDRAQQATQMKATTPRGRNVLLSSL